jgi:hypothetical protein
MIRISSKIRDDLCAVFACDVDGGISRAVIDDQDVIAGVERFQAAAQAECIVFGVQQGRERGHLRSVTFDAMSSDALSSRVKRGT